MTCVPNIANSTSTVRKKYSVFVYSEAEPHALYAIYIQMRTLCVLQYIFLVSIFSKKCFGHIDIKKTRQKKRPDYFGSLTEKMIFDKKKQ